jgi:hypothetical protein
MTDPTKLEDLKIPSTCPGGYYELKAWRGERWRFTLRERSTIMNPSEGAEAEPSFIGKSYPSGVGRGGSCHGLHWSEHCAELR